MGKKSAKKTGNDAEPEPLDLEAALAELERLVEHMESGELSLEESLRSFERGIQLTRRCQEALRAAEQKVQILLEREGEVVTEDFSAQDGG